MRRKRSVEKTLGVLILVIAGIAAQSADAVTIIGFEDIHPGYETSFIQIPPGYGGFNWSYRFRGVTSQYRLGTGYEYGTIGSVSAYTSGHQHVSMTSVNLEPFDFVGAYITAAWLNDEPFTVEGWKQGRLVYSSQQRVSTDGPHWFGFNFLNVDTVWFKPITEQGNHHIVIDNITIVRKLAGIEATIDIDPDTLNLKSKGKWVTCYIWLPEDYDVADIAPHSVLLEGQIEVDWIWFDQDEQVAIAKFSRSQVQNVQDTLSIGEVELTVSGELNDGTRFEGSDTIRVINKDGKK